MDFAEFDRLVEPLRERSARMVAAHDFPLIEARTATDDEIASAERALGVVLPARYKAFMVRYGGGQFGFVDLLTVPGRGADGVDDIVSVSRGEFPDGSFLAVAPVGTGDYWGFPVTDGRCHDEVWFRFHDAGEPTKEAADFLEFVARRGVRS
ncbi:SMI1/KNR4 family protein [Micromonospora sp. NPDC049559]|uniref:SMI1/KNR4 family protein n=1 Tax=Micromonospora sp. NPDC049559 TaxID=3155923 RepID=UPI00342DA956